LAGPAGRRSPSAHRHRGGKRAATTGKTTPPPPSSPLAAAGLDRRTCRILAALLACAIVPYLNILSNSFVYDDYQQLVQNPYVRSFQYLKEIFTASVWSFQSSAASNYYRPMMTLGYLIGYQIFGLQAYGFHLVSLFIHALVVCLVFALTQRLTGDRGWALVAGAWFALHPIHSESVAWIAAVTDLELTLFFLITFRIFLAMVKRGGGYSGRLWAAMGATFMLALLSKEQAMMLPVLATVYEHFYREDRSQTNILQKLTRYGLLWLLGAVYMLLRVHFLGGLAPNQKFRQVTPLSILLSALALLGQYVEKLVWPVRLCGYYIFHPSTSPLELRVLAGVAVLLVLAALFLVCWRHRDEKVRFASFAIVWFLATLAPVLNAHWLGENVFTERYLYLPSVGAAWLVGLGATMLWRRAGSHPARRQALVLVAVTVAILYAIRIVIRNRDWNNDVVFFTRTIESSPEPSLFISLGMALEGEGRTDEAIAQYTAALRLKPDFSLAHYDLGNALARQGRVEEAVAQYREVLRLKPDDFDAHNNLGNALASQGRVDAAAAEFAAALRINPHDPDAHYNLALELEDQGKVDAAVAQFSEALRLRPDDPDTHYNLGSALAKQGNTDAAIAQCSEALRLRPYFPLARRLLSDLSSSAQRPNHAGNSRTAR